jgi:GNAT superfamily N-acetyltransferase
MSKEMADPSYRRDLGDGLVLRWSNKSDIEAIAQLESIVFRDSSNDPPNSPLAEFTHEMMSDDYPLMGAGDFALIEDSRHGKNRLVACTCLWRQRWEYEGIPFDIGRPEFVATDTDYRNRGLIRAVFELIHARSEAEGHLAQGITGIPYFYRQFGYEYALDLDGNCTVDIAFSTLKRVEKGVLLPPSSRESIDSKPENVKGKCTKAEEGTTEPYTLRDATLEDLDLVKELYDRQRAAYSISSPIEQDWRTYQLRTWRMWQSGHGEHLQMIVDTSGSVCGYVIVPNARWRKDMMVWDLAVRPGVNLQAAMPSLLRALHAQGLQLPIFHNVPALQGICFVVGSKHPVYDVLSKELHPTVEAPYAWYVRVVDLAKFIRHIAPALERRLVDSALGAYNGELKLDFYSGGLRLVFEKGHLMTVEHWRKPIWNGDSKVDGGFPPLVFLQLLFGHRSLDELRYAFPDVRVEDRAELLLKTLFPKVPSWVMPLG